MQKKTDQAKFLSTNLLNQTDNKEATQKLFKQTKNVKKCSQSLIFTRIGSLSQQINLEIFILIYNNLNKHTV